MPVRDRWGKYSIMGQDNRPPRYANPTGEIGVHRPLYAQRKGSGISRESQLMIIDCCNEMMMTKISGTETEVPEF